MSNMKELCDLLEQQRRSALVDEPSSNLGNVNFEIVRELCARLQLDHLDVTTTSRSNSIYDSNNSTNSFSADSTIETAALFTTTSDGSEVTVLNKHMLVKYCYPILLLFGLVGNVLTFMVMCRLHRRKRKYQKFSLSLAMLALVDIAILIFACLVEYLEEVAGVNPRIWSVMSCKFIMFACYLFSCYSAYLHAFIAIERWYAISRPLNSMTRFTFKTNRLVLVLVFLMCTLINLPLLWWPTVEKSVEIDPTQSLGIRLVDDCVVPDGHDVPIFLIDSLFYCLVPFVVTTVFSALTLVKLIRIKRAKQQAATSGDRLPSSHDELISPTVAAAAVAKNGMHNSKANQNKHESSAANHSPIEVRFTKNGHVRTSIPDNQKNSSQNSIKKLKVTSWSINSHQSNSNSNVKLTLMLMALPISYLVTTFPIFLTLIFNMLLKTTQSDNMEREPNHEFAYSLAKIFMYVNSCINILFYVVFGKNLRDDFIALLTTPCVFFFHDDSSPSSSPLTRLTCMPRSKMRTTTITSFSSSSSQRHQRRLNNRPFQNSPPKDRFYSATANLDNMRVGS